MANQPSAISRQQERRQSPKDGDNPPSTASQTPASGQRGEHVVARVGELNPGDRKIVTVRGVQIGLFRVGDAYYALPNICWHQYGPVCTGKVGAAIIADASTDWEPEYFYNGEVLVCPWHGLEYRVTTGQCVAYPKVRLRQYPVKVDGDEIKIIL